MRGKKVRFGIAICVEILVTVSAHADTGLPVFDSAEGYSVIAPFRDRLLVRDRQGVTFLCEADVANFVLLSDCRPILTAEEVEFYVARQDALDHARLRKAEQDRLYDLPPVVFERAARLVLSDEGCQVRVPRNGRVREEILIRFAQELDVEREVQSDLFPLLDEVFTQSLDLLLSKGDLTFDRDSRVAELVECEQ